MLLAKKMDITNSANGEEDNTNLLKTMSDAELKTRELELDEKKEETRALEKKIELDIKRKEVDIKEKVANKPTNNTSK